MVDKKDDNKKTSKNTKNTQDKDVTKKQNKVTKDAPVQPENHKNQEEKALQETVEKVADQAQESPVNEALNKDQAYHTAVQCLVAVARHHGLDFSVESIVHKYALGHTEPTTTRFLRIAKENGLKAKKANLKWEDLWKLGESYPIIARLNNGNTVILAGVDGDPESGRAAVFDPLADTAEFILLPREKLEKAWGGEAIFVKRVYSLNDEKQPFSLRWFIPEILKQKRSFKDVIIAAMIMHIVALTTPIFFQLVIDKVLPHHSISTLWTLTIGIVILLIFDAIFDFLRNYLLLHATSKIDVRLATRTFGHMLQLPLPFFEHVSAGVLTKHMQQSSEIREFLTGKLFQTMLDASALFIFIPVLFVYSIPLSFVVLLFSALLALVIICLIGPFRRRLQELYRAEGERQALLVEAIHGMQTVKCLAIEPTQRTQWDTRAARAVAMHFRVGKISISARSISSFLEKLMTVVVVVVGALLVFAGSMTVGELVAFQMISGRVSGPLVQIVSLIHEYQEAALSVKMLGEVMNAPKERSNQTRGLMPDLKGRIIFRNVTFAYSQDAPPALNNVNLEFPSGKVVGIVGKSGSGKTTLTRLVQGLYNVQIGNIYLDGLDIREVDLSHLRRSLGVVLQESFIFRGTVRENISVTKTDATIEEIVKAAEMAGADEFIQRLPQGYDTHLEEKGSNLSGGQKQRLGIARALLTQPKILILDEATSALDPESETIVQENLRTIAEGRTVLVVSHRLSMLIDADVIVVMDEGKVMEIGSHKELLQKNNGLYKKLWDQQTKHIRTA